MARRTGPLADVRVLDASQVLSGPYSSMMLADAGADVIKIEPIAGGDHVRSWLVEGGAQPTSAYYFGANRSKRSVAIDLKVVEGRELFLQLAEKSDVLLENFRPGVMARLGVGYEEVKARNPKIVYCSVSGFGQTGPLSSKTAYDLIAAGYGGTMSVTGDEGGRYVRPGVPVSDLLAAMSAAFSILVALRERERSGRGTFIDVSLMESLVFAMSHHLVAYQLTGRLPGLHGSAHPQVAPYQTYRTATTDVNVAVLNDKQWRTFCEALEKPEWSDDPRYRGTGTRNQNRRALQVEIEAVFAAHPAEHWLELFEKAGIACGPIYTTADLLDDAHLRERGTFLDLDHPVLGRLRLPGAPWYAPGIAGEWTPPPEVGEHTSEVLSEVLALSDEKLRDLRDRGVIADQAVAPRQSD